MSCLSRVMHFNDVRTMSDALCFSRHCFFRIASYYNSDIVSVVCHYLLWCRCCVVILFVFLCTYEKHMYVRIALKWSQNDTKWLPKGCQLEDLKILYILSPILTWFLRKRQFWKSPGAPFKTNDRPKTVQTFQYGHFLAPRYHPWTSKCRYWKESKEL